jgi:nucleotide-binding universal stress UspA family protein
LRRGAKEASAKLSKVAQFVPKKLLCAVDLGEASAKVLRWAGLLARTFGARVEVLYADWWEPPRYFTEAQIQALVAQARAHRATVRQQLAALSRDALGPDVRHNLLVIEGQPATVILDHARHQVADLLVMGSHGRTGMARLRLGSVAEDVTRQTPCPVLIVKGDQDEGGLNIRQVLCPVNFTALARQCLELSAAVAGAFRARLWVAHAVEAKQADLVQRRESLCAWVPDAARAQCDLNEVIREGDAAEQIVRLASEHGADLVVIGAQHRPFLEYTTLGTTTERVMRHSSCSLLVVPRQLSE